MNEKIKSVLEQAALQVHANTTDDTPNIERDIMLMEKFAELIVKECGFYLLENGKADTMDIIDMEQHFGIE